MRLFKLAGNQSTIRLMLEHPIHLDEDKNYMLGLVGFYSDNFISNVNEDISNAFAFRKDKGGFNFPIFRNQYSFHDFEQRFKECLKIYLDTLPKEIRDNYNIQDFELIVNPDLKVRIKTPVEFWLDSPISKLLGFGDKLLKIKSNHEKSGEDYPKLRPFDVIEIHCNLIEPSITNHTSDIYKHNESEILYSFFPNVGYKQKISEKPNEIHYVPIGKDIKQIKDIIISIQDGRGNLLKNVAANNIIYLNLKAF